MRHTYQPVCSIAQQHSYFQNPDTASVHIVPTPDTARNLQRAGLLLKATSTAVQVLRAVREPEPGEVASPALPLPDFLFPLRFAVQPLSPYFGNFTKLPAAVPPGGHSIYYFRVGAGAPAAGIKLAITDALALPLTPLTIDLDSQTEGKINDLVRGQELPAAMLRPTATGTSVDLRPWGAGHYQLQQGDVPLLHCYADEQLHAARAWGVLEIDRAAVESGPLRIRLAFEGRPTQWRYLIRYRPTAEPAAPVPAGVFIKAKPGKDTPVSPVDFGKSFALRSAPLAGADLVFESDAPLALAERPGYACTLHYTLNGSPVEVALPAASGEVLCRPAVPATDPPGPAFSEIVVLL